MVAGRRTVFLLPETSGDLVSRAILECTHLIVSKIALDTTARGRGDLAAGCMGAGQGGPNLGEILKILGAIKLNPDAALLSAALATYASSPGL